jgi:hypothetical protein
MASFEISRKCLASRFMSLKEGNVNSIYFYVRVNGQRTKTHIERLKHNNGWVMEHDQKTAIIHDHFKTQTSIGRLSQLPNATFASSMQKKTFMEEEVNAAVGKNPK